MTLTEALEIVKRQADETEPGIKYLEEHPVQAREVIGPQGEQLLQKSRLTLDAMRLVLAWVAEQLACKALRENGRDCEACSGTGKIEGKDCSPCYGTGIRFLPREEASS